MNRLKVNDLALTLDFFTQQLGFRVEMIVPADAPHTAIISGQGLTMHIETQNPHLSQNTTGDCEAKQYLFNRSSAEGNWHTGRAGMLYRDLIPGRLGGRVVASHIRIPDGGVVPDYVHYHKVRFQMIYCKAGWVRVVYEDQGEPFVLEAGDCVLQPPEIRHRVLEASPGLEVIELGCPAIHETWADYELALPTPITATIRSFFGQRFVRHRAVAAQWQPWRLTGFNACDTGIAAATNGMASVKIVRADAPCLAASEPHKGEFVFFFVLAGELFIENVTQLFANDCCVIPAGMSYTLRATAGLEMLEVALTSI